MENPIHHYTSINNLALILNSKKIRFNRLDKVDDIKEIDGLTSGFCSYIYISCWTDEKEESIPLWKMYTENMHGVRISFPTKMFKRKLIEAGDRGNHGFTKEMYSPLSYEETVTEKYIVTNIFDNEASFFKRVIYDDNYPQFYKDNFVRTKEGLMVKNMFSLGAYKKEHWKFQNECRFTLYANPLLPLNHPLINGSREKQFAHISDAIINNVINETDFIDVDLNEDILDDIYLKTGPLCNDSDKIIVDALLNKYTKNGSFELSSLDGTIRK